MGCPGHGEYEDWRVSTVVTTASASSQQPPPSAARGGLVTGAKYPTAPKTATPPTISHNAPTASVVGWAGLARCRVTEPPCALSLGTCVCVSYQIYLFLKIKTSLSCPQILYEHALVIIKAT